MEGENVDVSSSNGSGGGDGGSSGGVGGSSSRWNPTRDQINILESLYSQGVRTPSADQIQKITNRLKEFGHIEGKNVFYWFQNHKARQRQKQKQESIAYMNHYLRTLPPSAPIFHPSHPNVVCSPFYVPPGAELGFYQSTPRFILPAATGSVKIRPRVDKLDLPVPRMCLNDINKQMEDNNNNNFNLKTQETLDLFPLTPTGFSSAPPPGTTSMESSSLEHSPASDHCASQEASGDQHSYFDFFSR